MHNNINTYLALSQTRITEAIIYKYISIENYVGSII